jgi:hypothetical protein
VDEGAKWLVVAPARSIKINPSSAKQPPWLGAKGSRVQIPPPRPISSSDLTYLARSRGSRDSIVPGFGTVQQG